MTNNLIFGFHKNSWEKILEKLFVFFAGLALFSPLVIFKESLRPFITGKSFFFQFSIEAMVFCAIILFVLNWEKYRPKKSTAMIFFGIFSLAILLSVVFSLNSYRSFWGNAERMEGLVNLIHFFLFAFLLSSILKFDKKRWRALIFWSLLVSFVAALYPLLQKMGLMFAMPGDNLARPGGSFGNPAFLSGYLLLHLFLAIWLICDYFSENKNWKSWRIWSVSGIFIVDLIVFFWTQTRGSWIGLTMGTVFFAVLGLFLFKNKRLKKLLIILLAILILASSMLFVFRKQIQNISWAQKIPIINRLAQISLSDSSSRARLVSWQWSLNWFGNRPVFGVGQDMFCRVFDDNYNADNFDKMSERFDRSHNKFIDTLVMNGIVGFVAYVLFYAALIFSVLRMTKKEENGWLKFGWLSLGAGLVAYAGHLFFVFDTPSNYVAFYFCAGLVLAFSGKRAVKIDEKEKALKNSGNGEKFNFGQNGFIAALISGILIFSLSFYYFNYRPHKASYLVYRAAAVGNSDLEKIFDYYRQAIGLNTFIDTETRRMWAEHFLKLMMLSRMQNTEAEAAAIKKSAEEVFYQMDLGDKKEPVIDYPVYRASIYTQLSWYKGFSDEERKEYAQKEDYWFNQILKNWPKRTDFSVLYAEDLIMKEKYKEADAWLKLLEKETPNFIKLKWTRAALDMVYNKKPDEILQGIISTINNGGQWDLNQRSNLIFTVLSRIDSSFLPQINQIFESQLKRDLEGKDVLDFQNKIDSQLRLERIRALSSMVLYNYIKDKSQNYSKMAEILEIYLSVDPQNADYWAKLAAVYGKMKNVDKAIWAAQNAASLNPNSYGKEVEAFIAIVRAGEWDKLP